MRRNPEDCRFESFHFPLIRHVRTKASATDSIVNESEKLTTPMGGPSVASDECNPHSPIGAIELGSQARKIAVALCGGRKQIWISFASISKTGSAQCTSHSRIVLRFEGYK